MREALAEAGLDSIDHLDNVVTTGYGRLKVPFASENVSEITCHAKGAQWLIPSIRTVIDIGGQDCKVISVTPKGMVGEFLMNDRCAAGTGRFFEGIARGLGCGLEGISDLANQGEEPCVISNQCSVFAESEVVTLVNEGVEVRNIISGINLSVAKRLKAMVKRIGVIEDVALTGGCSKNDGLSKAVGDLEPQLDERFHGHADERERADPQAVHLECIRRRPSQSLRAFGAHGYTLGLHPQLADGHRFVAALDGLHQPTAQRGMLCPQSLCIAKVVAQRHGHGAMLEQQRAVSRWLWLVLEERQPRRGVLMARGALAEVAGRGAPGRRRGIVSEHGPQPMVRLEVVDERLHRSDVAWRSLQEQAQATQ